MKDPLVSIIVPNYNHAPYLKERIESILNQTYSNYELIVLDDRSSDESLIILEKYREIINTLIVNDKNSGSPFSQWQKGIAAAKGEWIWISESDDYCEPGLLENLLNPEFNADIRYCQSTDVDTTGKIIIDRLETTKSFKPNIWESNFEMDGKTFCREYLKVKNVIPNASAVIFRKNLIRPGIFTEELMKMKMCGDWLFWSRILQNSSIAFCAKHLNYFRFHTDSSRTHRGFEKIALRLLEETKVRVELEKIDGMNQMNELTALKKKWYAIHRIGQVFSPEFNKFNSERIFSNFGFAFLIEKFKNRFYRK